MKKLALIFVLLFMVSCSSGGGDGDSSNNPFPEYPKQTIKSIETETGEPQYSGLNFEFKQGDYWLYDWKDEQTQRSPVPTSYIFNYPYDTIEIYSWDTTTKTGTFKISLGEPKQFLGITFYEVLTEYTGDAKNVTFPWSHIAAHNNKIYGHNEDGVYIIFDAHNGTWKGGAFFFGPNNEDMFGPAGTLRITHYTSPDTYCVSFPTTNLLSGLWNYAYLEYYTPNIGPAKMDISNRSDKYHSYGDETLTLTSSSFL